jgi:hypothetical protein
MVYHIISFHVWDDFVRGLNTAADIGQVDCRPNRTIIVSDEQLKAIKEAKIQYDNGTKRKSSICTPVL